MRKGFAIGCGTVRQRRLAIGEPACQILLLSENELNKTDCIIRHYAEYNERKSIPVSVMRSNNHSSP